MQTGLDVLIRDRAAALRGRRFGVMMNQASVTADYRYACDALTQLHPGRLKCLLTPQHGLWGEQQANMIETQHGRYRPLDIPVHSLYADTREPTDAMLNGIDCLVVDLQDVGCRVYTYIWTIVNCLHVAAERSLEVLILDRPNPVGPDVHGQLADQDFFSFVGLAPIPLQHGLTIGELALVVNDLLGIGANVSVIPISNWNRSDRWPVGKRDWIPPSPNLPSVESVAWYPGMVLLEGTNLSEGRGTTTPFCIAGAPWIDEETLAHRLSEEEDVLLRPTRFVPTFDKYRGESCGGLYFHRTHDRAPSVRLAMKLIAACAELWPDSFRWTPPPYEYEHNRMPIDILYGSDAFRESVDASRDVTQLPDVDVELWSKTCQEHLLYSPIG